MSEWGDMKVENGILEVKSLSSEWRKKEEKDNVNVYKKTNTCLKFVGKEEK